LLVEKSIYKPQVFPDFMTIRSWDPEKGYLDLLAKSA
jgi:hypothetical protein